MVDRAMGKSEATVDYRTLRMASYLRPSLLPPVPAQRRWSFAVARWGMLRNDKLGCCVPAGGAHFSQSCAANAGRIMDPTDAQVVQAYVDAAGYNPADPLTDQGTNMLVFMKLWRKKGWWGQPILAFVAVSWTDLMEVMSSINIFGGVMLGLALPQTALQQIDAGQPWDVVRFGGPAARPGTWGLHLVVLLDYDHNGFTCLTWGQRQLMTARFLQKYGDEAYTCIVPEWRAINGISPSGFDEQSMLGDLIDIGM